MQDEEISVLTADLLHSLMSNRRLVQSVAATAVLKMLVDLAVD